MDCTLIKERMLIDHCFGCLEDADRQAVEDHLMSCPACLRDYFAAKRRLDGVAEVSSVDPSNALRSRIRESVAKEFGQSRVLRPAWSQAWRQPWPSMAFVGGCAALVAAVWIAWPKGVGPVGNVVVPVESAPELRHAGETTAVSGTGAFETDASRSLTDVEGIL